MGTGSYFETAGQDFDLTEELTIAIGCAQFFIEAIGMEEEKVLAEFNLSKEVYYKHKSLPQS